MKAISPAFFLFLLAACSAVTAQAPQPPTHALTITRAEYDAGSQVKSPSWKAHVSLQNSSTSEWILGPAFVVIETGEPIKEVSHYVYRDRENDSDGREVFEERFGLFFGYRVESDGTAIIPFAALRELVPKDSGAFLSLFLATLSSPRLPVMAGGGFGRIGGRGKRDFDLEVIAPAAPKQRGPIIAVLPAIRARQPANAIPYHVWYEFLAADVKSGEALTGGKAFTAPRTAAGLIAEVNRAESPLWRRRLSLNWLAEDFPAQSTETIIQIAQQVEAGDLRTAALINIGTGKIRSGGPFLASLVEKDSNLRLLSVRALGRLGDPTHASGVRKFLEGSEPKLKKAVIEALGSMKDSESVPALMALLKTREKDPDYQILSAAARAITKINGDAAYADLVALAGDAKSAERIRLAIIGSFGAGAPNTVVDGLSQIISQQPRSNSFTRDCTEAIGRFGTPAALTTLISFARDKREDVAEDAIRAITRNTSADWRKAMIGLASSPEYKHRAKALYYLGLFDVKEAAATAREAAASTDSNVAKSACSALQSLKETPPPICK